MPQMMPHSWMFIFIFLLLLFLLMIIIIHFCHIPSMKPSSPSIYINKWTWQW